MVIKAKLSTRITAAIATIATVSAILSIAVAQSASAQADLNPIFDDVNELLEESGVDREIVCPDRLSTNGCDPIDVVPTTGLGDLCESRLVFEFFELALICG